MKDCVLVCTAKTSLVETYTEHVRRAGFENEEMIFLGCNPPRQIGLTRMDCTKKKVVAAIVELTFCSNGNPQSGLDFIAFIRSILPECPVICMVESSEMCAKYCDALTAVGVQTTFNLQFLGKHDLAPSLRRLTGRSLRAWRDTMRPPLPKPVIVNAAS